MSSNGHPFFVTNSVHARLRERTNLLHSAAFITIVALGSGCSVSIDATATNAEAIIEADFEGDCQGQGTDQNSFGVVNYAKDDSSGSCVITLDWAGTLVDMGPIKEDIEDDADGRDITLEEIEILLKVVSIRDANDQEVEVPTLESFQGSVSIGGTPLYALDGASLDALVSEEGLRFVFSGENDPVVRAINAALEDGGPLAATAQAELTMSSILPLQTGNPHRIVLRHDIQLTASVPLL